MRESEDLCFHRFYIKVEKLYQELREADSTDSENIANINKFINGIFHELMKLSIQFNSSHLISLFSIIHTLLKENESIIDILNSNHIEYKGFTIVEFKDIWHKTFSRKQNIVSKILQSEIKSNKDSDYYNTLKETLGYFYLRDNYQKTEQVVMDNRILSYELRIDLARANSLLSIQDPAKKEFHTVQAVRSYF